MWGDREQRNERRVNEDLRCRYEGCERLCRSGAGLGRHESMMHRRVEGRVRFTCEDYGLEVATKGALVGHRRTCRARRRLGDAEPEYPTRTSPVTYSLAGLGGGGAVAAGDEGGGVLGAGVWGGGG